MNKRAKRAGFLKVFHLMVWSVVGIFFCLLYLLNFSNYCFIDINGRTNEIIPMETSAATSELLRRANEFLLHQNTMSYSEKKRLVDIGLDNLSVLPEFSTSQDYVLDVISTLSVGDSPQGEIDNALRFLKELDSGPIGNWTVCIFREDSDIVAGDRLFHQRNPFNQLTILPSNRIFIRESLEFQLLKTASPVYFLFWSLSVFSTFGGLLPEMPLFSIFNDSWKQWHSFLEQLENILSFYRGYFFTDSFASIENKNIVFPESLSLLNKRTTNLLI